VLRGVAVVFERTLREIDTAGRWGGEEFVAILPGTSREGAALVAERLRAAVAAQPIAELRVTASFGVADTAADDLFAAADGALYRAKAAGKNRVYT
jgi:diguanylate cyclase (GGDEF)-like protein